MVLVTEVAFAQKRKHLNHSEILQCSHADKSLTIRAHFYHRTFLGGLRTTILRSLRPRLGCTHLIEHFEGQLSPIADRDHHADLTADSL